MARSETHVLVRHVTQPEEDSSMAGLSLGKCDTTPMRMERLAVNMSTELCNRAACERKIEASTLIVMT